MSGASQVCGGILAGGRARRLGGISKGALKGAQGQSIVGRIISEMSSAGVQPVAVFADDSEPYQGLGVEAVPDLRPGHGPLSGVEAALNWATGRSDGVLLAPCDTPAISGREFRVLIDAFAGGDSRIVQAVTGDSLCHPLCAVVDRAVLPEVSAAIDRGELSVQALWRRLGATDVRFGDPAPFLNVNTPADLKQWRNSPGGRRPVLRVAGPSTEKAAWLAAELGIDLEVLGPAAESGGGRAADFCLQSSITCGEAHVLAAAWSVPVRTVGRFLQQLGVKIRRCELGCFR